MRLIERLVDGLSREREREREREGGVRVNGRVGVGDAGNNLQCLATMFSNVASDEVDKGGARSETKHSAVLYGRIKRHPGKMPPQMTTGNVFAMNTKWIVDDNKSGKC